MDKFRQFFSTSEGWGLVVSAILGVFVAQGLISEDIAKVALNIITTALTFVFLRVAKKTVSPGEIPFVPSGGAK
jgi:hypothetical protein